MKTMRIYRFLSIFVFVSYICSAQQAHNSQVLIDQHVQDAHNTIKTITSFIEQAKSLGFSDQEVTEILEQARQKGLTGQEVTDFLKRAITDTDKDPSITVVPSLDPQENVKDQDPESKMRAYFRCAVLASAGVLAAWLLYELYEMIKLKNTREVTLRSDPADAIPEADLKKAEERIRDALRDDKDPKKIVFDLANEFSDQYEDQAVFIRARWNNGGAHHNMSVEV